MSTASFIQAIPKVELGLQLEGSIPQRTMLMIADQNEVGASVKKFDDLLARYKKPDAASLPELMNTGSGWFRHADDLTRAVYDAGVQLSKQNVRYAEIGVSPSLYMTSTGLPFEQFMEALHDGADRARRGWKVQIGWVLNIPRAEPRRADEIARWAAGATGRKFGVVGVGLVGNETSQPVGQFERAFRNAEKKEIPRVVQAGYQLGVEGVIDALHGLSLNRVLSGRGTAESDEAIELFNEKAVPLDVSLSEAMFNGWAASDSYPLRKLYDENLKLTMSARLPEAYSKTLSDEYLMAVEQAGLSLDEVCEIALNGVRYSFLPPEEKQAMLAEFERSYEQLRAEHIAAEEAE